MRPIATSSCAPVRERIPVEKRRGDQRSERARGARCRSLTDKGELSLRIDDRLECTARVQRATHAREVAVLAHERLVGNCHEERMERAAQHIDHHDRRQGCVVDQRPGYHQVDDHLVKKQRIEGGSRVKKLLKRTKNILKRVEKILSKKKGTRKMKGGMEESHPPPLFQLIPDIEVDKIFTFTVDDEEGVYRVTKLAQEGSIYKINSIKVGSESSPIRLYLTYNLSNGKVTVTEESTIPSSPQVTLGREDVPNVHDVAEILGITIYEARLLVLRTKKERNDPEMFRHPPEIGGTRKHKKSKKKGTRKMKGGMEESHTTPSLSDLIPDIAVDSIFTFIPLSGLHCLIHHYRDVLVPISQ